MHPAAKDMCADFMGLRSKLLRLSMVRGQATCQDGKRMFNIILGQKLWVIAEDNLTGCVLCTLWVKN